MAVWGIIAWWAVHVGRFAGTVAIVLLALFVFRILLSWRSRPATGPVPDIEVAVVLPMYNEDPRLLRRCLESLARQTRVPERVWLLDDGSSNTAAVHLARTFQGPFRLIVLRSQANHGKREAQAEAFRRDTKAGVFVTSDSDTIFHQDAIREGLRALADDRVMAVAGLVRAANRSRNLLTRMQDAEYLSSFLVERAWLSKLQGSVLVTSGGLAFYRASLVREILDEYLAQRFAGRPVHTGDDRMLTQLALQRGRVVLQHSAVADTAVPERLSHLLRQRVRWSRSVYVNSLWVFRNMRLTSWSFWLSVYNIATLASLFLTIGVVLVVAPVAGAKALAVGGLSVMILSYTRAGRVLVVQLPDQSALQRLSSFLMVGPAVLFNLTVLLGVRLWALIRIRQVSNWGTRRQIEVRA